MYSLIIPVYNEEQSINDVIDNCYSELTKLLSKKMFEIIVVDDGSTDNSADIIQSKLNDNIRSLQHPYCRGVGAARTTGVLNAQGDKILFIDADSTYDPHDFKNIISLLNTHDMVIGARVAEKGTLPILRSSIKILFCMLASWLTHKKIPDLNSGLRGMDREKTIQFLYMLPLGHSWVSTITLCFLASNYTIEFVPILYHKRRGKSSFKIISDTYSFFLTIVKTIVYFYPLRVIMPLSMFFFAGTIVFLIRDLLQRNIADTTILLCVVGVLIFIFSLISEQLACLRRELNQKVLQHEK